MDNFVIKPNLPEKNVKCVIVDHRASEQIKLSLKAMGIKIISTISLSNLQNPVCGHPDMMLHHIGENKFVAAEESYDYFKSQLFGAELIQGSKSLQKSYPNDILYNCASFGDYAVCNAHYTAIEILSEYQSIKKKILNVKQGYSKCSICIIDDNAIITADEGINRICTEAGIDVFKIRPGFINLAGMDYGFIGGASGLISKTILAVAGDISTHPDYKSIISFCRNYGIYIECLKKDVLEDIGTIIPIF